MPRKKPSRVRFPALLASFADVASSPNGARQLTNTLTQQSGSLESLKNLIGGSGQNSLAETGSSMLSGLFGGGTLDTMAQTIGKFAGIGEGTSKSMLGMLGPVVLGALGQASNAARVSTQAGWCPFSLHRRIRLPRQYRPVSPVS
jgi:hypothetical protein